MYENITYESILQRMLDRIPDDMDKREGAVIYDALAPAAVELQLMYIELDTILRDTFASTTTDRDCMVLRAAERGITPGDASVALVKGTMTPASVNVPVGSRFSCGLLNYIVTEKIKAGEYQLQCETSGSEANGNIGQLIPINYISGLETAQITELLVPGEDEEGLESIRKRYLANANSNRKIEQQLETAQAVTDCKIDELTREVREHNNFARRMPVVEEQIRVINHRIKDLEQEG